MRNTIGNTSANGGTARTVYTVFMVTNTTPTSGTYTAYRKKYVGISDVNIRAYVNSKGEKFKYVPLLGEDIEKYGWMSFEFEVLAETSSINDAYAKAAMAIIKNYTYDPRTGYNIMPMVDIGGWGGSKTKNPHKTRPNQKSCTAYDTVGNVIQRYRSAAEAAADYGVSPSWMYSVCKNHGKLGGAVWAYDNPSDPRSDACGNALLPYFGDEVWTQSELAKSAGKSASTVCRQVAALVKRGLVEKTSDGRYRKVLKVR